MILQLREKGGSLAPYLRDRQMRFGDDHHQSVLIAGHIPPNFDGLPQHPVLDLLLTISGFIASLASLRLSARRDAHQQLVMSLFSTASGQQRRHRRPA